MESSVSSTAALMTAAQINLTPSRRGILTNISSTQGPALYIAWGSRGAGKSWMLNQLRIYCQEQGWLPVMLDLKAILLPDLNASALPAALQHAWRSALHAALPAASTLADAAAPQAGAEPHLQEWTAGELELLSQRKVLFLIDNLDDLLQRDENAFFTAETHTIAPLLKAGAVLAAVSSVPIQRQWRSYETRRRCVTFHLEPLSAAEVAQLLKLEHEDEIRFAHEATAGHPKAVEWLRELTSQQPEATLREKKVHWPLWKNQIGQKASEFFLNELPPETRKFAAQACLLRWFNVSLLRQTLKVEHADDGEYLRQINALNRAGLTVWDIERGAYRFADPAVRQLVARHANTVLPDKGKSIHSKAYQYYLNETRYPEYIYDSLPEALYHHVQWRKGSRALVDEWQGTLLLELEKSWQHVRKEEWQAVEHNLDGRRYQQQLKQADMDSAEREAEAARRFGILELAQASPPAYDMLLQFVRKQSESKEQ